MHEKMSEGEFQWFNEKNNCLWYPKIIGIFDPDFIQQNPVHVLNI